MNKLAKTLGIGAIALSIGLGFAGESEGMMKFTPKTYEPMYYHPPISTLEQQINTNRAPYVKIKNNIEYIPFNKDLAVNENGTNYMPIKYYSNVKKKSNEIKLKENQCVYDGIMIEGNKDFREDVIKSWEMLRENCKEEFDTIRNGIITEQGDYCSGIGQITANKGGITTPLKSLDEVTVSRHLWKNRGMVNYHKILASALGNEGYRLVYWGKWNQSWMKAEKQGIIITHRVLKKLNASPHLIRQMERLLDEENKDKFKKLMTY